MSVIGNRFSALMLALVVAPAMVAQESTGSIRGTVRAKGGEVLAGVQVRFASPALQGVRTVVTDSQGSFRAPLLPPGSYRLTETKTAEGYTLLAEPIKFTLTADGQCLRDGAAFGAKTTGADGVYNIALTIYNRKGFTLPHTGADAPSLWLLIGLPALVAVLLVLVFRYKRGGKRS